MEIPCHHCGRLLNREPYRLKRARFCFCSNECKQANHDFNKYAGERSGAANRHTGTIGYVKLEGRHAHRVLAEIKIGRRLLRGEVVHHIDGNKKNNALSNLQVLTQSEHVRLHWPEMMAARKRKAGY